MSDEWVAQIVGMGFDVEQAREAIEATGGAGVAQAVEHLFAAVGDAGGEAARGAPAGGAPAAGGRGGGDAGARDETGQQYLSASAALRGGDDVDDAVDGVVRLQLASGDELSDDYQYESDSTDGGGSGGDSGGEGGDGAGGGGGAAAPSGGDGYAGGGGAPHLTAGSMLTVREHGVAGLGGLGGVAAGAGRVLDGDSIRAALAHEVEKAASTFELPLTTAGALLRHFKWDYERFAEDFSSSPARVLAAAGLDGARDERGGAATPVDDVECSVCMDDVAAAECRELRLRCGHVFCRDCWRAHLAEAVRNGDALGVGCMEAGCGETMSEAFVRRVAPEALLTKWSALAVASFVDEHPSIRWCPATDCGKAIWCRSLGARDLHCTCGAAFCFRCRQEAHEPAACEEMRRWAKKATDESETATWLVAHTKDCPKCHTPIEKNGGCQHMTCTKRGCGHEWCWFCLRAWRGHKACNVAGADAAGDDPVGTKSARTSLRRYMYHWMRFKEHEKSQGQETALREAALVKMVALQVERGTSCFGGDVSYIDRATEQLITCRRALKCSFVHGFYLGERDRARAAAEQKAREAMGAPRRRRPASTTTPERAMFQFLQAELEETTNNLSHLLEQDYWALDATRINDCRVAAAKKLEALLERARDGYVARKPGAGEGAGAAARGGAGARQAPRGAPQRGGARGRGRGGRRRDGRPRFR